MNPEHFVNFFCFFFALVVHSIIFRLPSNQQPANDANDNRSLSPSSVESNEEDALILEQVNSHYFFQTKISMVQRKMLKTPNLFSQKFDTGHCCWHSANIHQTHDIAKTG